MIGLATSTAIGTAAERSWLSAFRRYMAFVASASLIWEIAHLPLYSIWLTATPPELAFAVFHCTGGDILIALSSLTLALIAVGSPGWPRESRRPVLVLTVLIGVGYTIFSEWLNIEIRQAWAYRDIMPVLPLVGVGLSPLLQWAVIPVAASLWAWRAPANLGRPAHD